TACDAIHRDEYVARAITGLLLCGRPSNVAGLVYELVLDSIERLATGTLAEVLVDVVAEHREVVSPCWMNRYANVRWISLRVGDAFTKRDPTLVQRSPVATGIAVRPVEIFSMLASKATA